MNEQQLKDLIREEIIKTLGFSNGIPLQIDQSFKDRYTKNFIPFDQTTDINATDRQQTTSSGGGDLVPQTFVGLLKAKHPRTGVNIYIPHY